MTDDAVPDRAPSAATAPFTVRLDGDSVTPDVVPAIAAVASEYPGTHPLVLDVSTGHPITVGQDVDPTPDFIDTLRRILRAHAR